MKISNLKEVLGISRLAQDTLIIQGKHGIGKSSVVQQYCYENDYYLVELFLSNQEVGDLIGYPETRDGVQYWSMPVWLHRMYEAQKAGKHCVLHLDELNRADTDVLQAALQLVLEGKIHEHSLPILDSQKTQVLASINPPGDYNVHELDPALLDRFLLVNIEVDLKSSLRYFRERDVHDSITEFLSENPKYLHFMPEDLNEKGASPRSWEKLSNYIKIKDSIPDELLIDIVTGKIGVIPGMEYYVFLNSDNVKIQDIIDSIEENKDKFSDIRDLADVLPKLGTPIQKTNAIYNIKDPFHLLVYLYSLEQEILIMSLKNLKSSNVDLFKKIVDLDDSLNNKNLFKKATTY